MGPERGRGVAGAAYRVGCGATTLVAMGLQGFERGLERMVEGVFSRGSKSGIRPVELGRRLLREMDDHRSVDVKGRRIVPNEFTFRFSERDHASFEDYREALTTELSETVREYARTEGYHFMGPVSVAMEVNPEQKPGRFELGSRMREGAGVAGVGSLILPSGQRIPLDKPVIIIGRLPECDVSLSDPNVSRRHTEVRSAGTGFFARDLGSTNGTMVNGLRLHSDQPLNDGDILSVGGTHMRFEAL